MNNWLDADGKRDPGKQRYLADWRLLVSVWLLSIASVFFVLSYFAATNYARDIFFYADTYVSTQINIHGTIPLQPQADHLNSWGKIATRIKLPGFPLFLSVVSIVSGANINKFYLYFPVFFLSGFIFLIFFRDLTIPPLQRHLLAAAAGIATPATAMYTLSAAGLSRTLFYFSVYMIYILFRSLVLGERRNVFVYLLPLVLYLFTLFYWYPPHYGKVMLLTGFLIIGSLSFGQIRAGVAILPVVGTILFLQIFNLSLDVYVYYITLAIGGIATFSFSLPTGENTAPLSTSLPPEYYSLLPLILLLPLSIYGGMVVLRTAWVRVFYDKKASTSPSSQFALFVIFWGACVLLLSAVYIASSTAFLISRPYLFALPVIFLGAGVAISRLSSWNVKISTGVSVLLLALVLVSTGLQATSAGVAIHSYEPKQPATQEWVTEYDPGLIYTDTVRGAPLAATGYFDVIYPKTESQLLSIFYQNNYSIFVSAMRARNADVALFSRSMINEGLFGESRLNKPMSTTQYQLRIAASSRVYHNGQHSLITPTNESVSSKES